MTCGAVIVAAGRSERMGLNKTTMSLAGRPVILRVINVLDSVPDITTIIVVASAEKLSDLATLIDSQSYQCSVDLCLGGETRQDSVRNGVHALPADVDLVLVHDAARPLVTAQLVRNAIAKGEEFGAAIPAIPITDTIKLVESGDRISRTLDRSRLYAAQTPQVFRRDWLEMAYERTRKQADMPAFTDESSLLESTGFDVRIFPGSVENIKLTTPFDLVLAESILTQREQVVH